MDNNNQLASQLQTQTYTNSNSESSSDYQAKPSEQLIKFLINLFSTWKVSHATKMKDQDWGKQRIELWAIALTDLRATKQELERALRKSISQSWLPTTAADFLELGRQASSEYPDSYIAYVKAANRNYLHPAAHETAKRIGIEKLAGEPEYTTLKIWNEVYKTVCTEHSQDSVKFNQNLAEIERSKQNDKKVLEAPKMSLEEQSAIADKYINLIRKSL